MTVEKKIINSILKYAKTLGFIAYNVGCDEGELADYVAEGDEAANDVMYGFWDDQFKGYLWLAYFQLEENYRSDEDIIAAVQETSFQEFMKSLDEPNIPAMNEITRESLTIFNGEEDIVLAQSAFDLLKMSSDDLIDRGVSIGLDD